jgi:hypothetical protein
MPTVPVIRFDEATHTYWQGSERVPSVTQILGAMTNFDGIRPEVLDFARQRGQAAHLGTELYDQGVLDWDSVDDEIRPYIEAWQRFRSDTGFEPDLIEERVHHPLLRYAGTLDRTGWFGDTYALVDIKCVAAMSPCTGPQTAAYAKALQVCRPDLPEITERYAVQLLPTGRYKLHTYQKRDDFSVFLSMRTIMGWADTNKQRIQYEPA